MTDAVGQADEAFYKDLCRTLAEEATAAVGPWIQAAVSQRAGSPRLDAEALAAADNASSVIGSQLQSFFALDIDAQATNPLAILRQVVPFATDVLAAGGLPAVARDRQATELHPDDPYDLTPGAFSDFGDAVQDAGLRWGAAKAHLHLSRRRDIESNTETP